MAKKKSFNFDTILVIILILVFAAGIYFTFSDRAEEAPKAPEVTVTLLGTDCEDCFDINIATGFLQEQLGINVTNIKKLTIEESKELTEKYEIEKLPAILIEGYAKNETIMGFEQKEDAFVFKDSPPPYYDLNNEKVKGKITAIQLEADCTRCFNISQPLDQLQSMGIVFEKRKTVQQDSSEGKALIEKYNITKVPALILDKEAEAYQLLTQQWSEVGTMEKDGSFVLRNIPPPYIETETGNVIGLVEITYLTDKTCKECYDPKVFKELFSKGFGMVFKAEKEIDVSSGPGRVLVKNYGIELVPTAILSREASEYQILSQLWAEVGTVQKDEKLVFTALQSLGTAMQKDIVYKNLTSGEVMTEKFEKQAQETILPEE